MQPDGRGGNTIAEKNRTHHQGIDDHIVEAEAQKILCQGAVCCVFRLA